MSRFLVENWIWILTPALVLATLVVIGVLLGGAEAQAPFAYALF
jgi:hypothetical protein